MKHKPAPAPVALGNKVTRFTKFDTFPRPNNCCQVKCSSDEVTANCPVTNQPDWYNVEIDYTPRRVCLESKSLKLYLHSFRNRGLFCEAFAAKIAQDLANALTTEVVVKVTQKPRGGVSIVATAVANPTQAARENARRTESFQRIERRQKKLRRTDD